MKMDRIPSAWSRSYSRPKCRRTPMGFNSCPYYTVSVRYMDGYPDTYVAIGHFTRKSAAEMHKVVHRRYQPVEPCYRIEYTSARRQKIAINKADRLSGRLRAWARS